MKQIANTTHLAYLLEWNFYNMYPVHKYNSNKLNYYFLGKKYNTWVLTENGWWGKIFSQTKHNVCFVSKKKGGTQLHKASYFIRSSPGINLLQTYEANTIPAWWYTCRNEIWLVFLRKTKNTWKIAKSKSTFKLNIIKTFTVSIKSTSFMT